MFFSQPQSNSQKRNGFNPYSLRVAWDLATQLSLKSTEVQILGCGMATFHAALTKLEALRAGGGKTVGKNALCGGSHCHCIHFRGEFDLMPWLLGQ